jgi:hypothetical protein
MGTKEGQQEAEAEVELEAEAEAEAEAAAAAAPHRAQFTSKYLEEEPEFGQIFYIPTT